MPIWSSLICTGKRPSQKTVSKAGARTAPCWEPLLWAVVHTIVRGHVVAWMATSPDDPSGVGCKVRWAAADRGERHPQDVSITIEANWQMG